MEEIISENEIPVIKINSLNINNPNINRESNDKNEKSSSDNSNLQLADSHNPKSSRDNTNLQLADSPIIKKENFFQLKKLKRAESKKFDFLSLETDYFDNENCNCFSNKSVSGEILYENANNYLTEFLDIQTLFNNYQEVEMLKKFLFDYDQRKLFEILAKLSNLPNVFSLVDSSEKVDLLDKDDNQLLFTILDRINERSNEYDLKMTNCLRHLFKK